jgi:hypothetical protein
MSLVNKHRSVQGITPLFVAESCIGYSAMLIPLELGARAENSRELPLTMKTTKCMLKRAG